MKSIRAGRGLGDAIYLQSIVRHLVARGSRLDVRTDWPGLFRCFGDEVKTSEFRRSGIDIVAHYTMRKREAETDQFEDCCISAGIEGPVDLRLEWAPQTVPFEKSGKPLVAVHLPRPPFGRTDGYGMDLLPDWQSMQAAIDALQGRAFIVQLGSGQAVHRFSGIDLDLAGKTTFSDLLDWSCLADAFVGYCSFFVPLAEALKRPALFVWSTRGMRSRDHYIRAITPTKILHRESSRYVLDDCSSLHIAEAVDALLEAAGSR